MVEISGIEIKAEEIVSYLKKQVQLKDVCYNILHQRIIDQALNQNQLEVTEREIQVESNKIRRQRNLEQASDTFAWLDDQLISSEDWEAGIYEQLAAHKLAVHLFSEKVQEYFDQNQHQFEQILLYQILIPYYRLAWEIFYQIEEEEISFYQAAHLYDIDPDRRIQCGYVGKVYRSNLKPEIATRLFQVTPNTVMTPIQSDQGYHIFLVEDFIAPELTDELYQTLLNQMFQNWLSKEVDYMLFNQIESQELSYSNQE